MRFFFTISIARTLQVPAFLPDISYNPLPKHTPASVSPRPARSISSSHSEPQWCSANTRAARKRTPLTPLGIPGYTLWSNLYVSSGALLAVQPDRRDPTEPEWLATRQIMSGEKRPTGGYGAADEERWRVVDESVASGELGKRGIFLSGVTVSLGFWALIASRWLLYRAQ